MKQSTDMGEFASMEEWDLQAVVGGGMLNESTTMIDNNQSSWFSHLSNQQDVDDLDFLFPSSEHFESTADFSKELEEFYKPFYAILHPLSPQITPSSPSSVSVTEMKSPQKVQQHQNQKRSTVGGATTSAVHAVKYKKRKNQHKKVVLQVTAEELSSDMWAWRKYGQKPIKGSPYPRSYYRCSSSKGCLARKQVEQSCSDPEMFIITYTAEHSHSQPTRRNSLAGTTRHKFPAAKSSTKTDHNAAKTRDYTSPNSTAVLSPTTPLIACRSEVDCPQQKRINEVEIEMKFEESDDNELSIPDMTMGDDFFDGLDEFISDVSIAFCS